MGARKNFAKVIAKDLIFALWKLQTSSYEVQIHFGLMVFLNSAKLYFGENTNLFVGVIELILLIFIIALPIKIYRYRKKSSK